MKTKNTNSNRSFRAAAAVAALLLAGFSAMAQSQNMFVGDDAGAGNTIVEFPAGGGPASPFAAGLNYPNAMAFNSAGVLYVADEYSGNAYEYQPNGTRSILASSLVNPLSLAIDASGNVFVGTENNNILEFPTGGGQTTFASGLSTPSALAFYGGNLYEADLGTGTINEFSPAKVESTFASGLSTGSVDGLAFDTAGNLYVAEGYQADSIIKITQAKVQSTYASGLNVPIGLAFDNAGNLFVADGGAFSSTGDITEFPAGGGQTVYSTAVSKPLSIAFQPVPEPSTLALLGTAAGAFLVRRRKA